MKGGVQIEQKGRNIEGNDIRPKTEEEKEVGRVTFQVNQKEEIKN